VISQAASPDGKRNAQVERIVVGGVTSIVVMVRQTLMPNWYLTGCAAAYHYDDAEAQVRWVSNSAIEVTRAEGQLYWNTGSAPFQHDPCENLTVTFNQE
jgi:hypothetical protein